MSHFLHYWAPKRANLAFDAAEGPIQCLENGWFKRLHPGDVLWICTLDHGENFFLVLRMSVDRVKQITSVPPYAISNSKIFSHWRAYAAPASVESPRQIPWPWSELRGLQLDAETTRVWGSRREALEGPLASLRRLAPASHGLLERLWAQKDEFPWRGPVPE